MLRKFTSPSVVMSVPKTARQAATAAAETAQRADKLISHSGSSSRAMNRPIVKANELLGPLLDPPK